MPIAASSVVILAFRALGRHKTRSALNTLGISVGIASVVWVVAIGEAGTARAQALFDGLGDNLVWVEAGARNINGVRTGTLGTRNLLMGDAEAIFRDVPNIRRVSPNLDGTILAVYGDRNWTTHYRGVALDYFEIKRWSIASGAFFTDEDVERDANVCVIGQTVKNQLFGDADPVGEILRIGVIPFRVVGLLAAKGPSATGQDQDDSIMFPYTTAIKRIRADGLSWLDDVLCSTYEPDEVRPAAKAIALLMRDRHHIGSDQEDDFNIRHPEELIQAQIQAARTLEALLLSVASVSLVVGGIGVMNVMLASVAERTREIGIRLAVGASDRAIEAQFLAEAVILTTIGGLLGIALSFAGSTLITHALGWALSIPAPAVLVAVAFSVVTGLFFGFAPARRAARLDPIEALRSE